MPLQKLSEDNDDLHIAKIRVVSVRNALRLLGTSRQTLYRRLRSGELESFADGGRRKITLESIRQYVARRCEETSLSEAKRVLREAGQAERPSAQAD